MSSRRGVPRPRERKVRADAELNRARVLAAAQAAFADEGLNALIPDIARRAEVGIGTVYRHFPTKEALVAALLEDRVAALRAAARQALAAADPWDGLSDLLGQLGVLAAQDRAFCEVVVSHGMSEPWIAGWQEIDTAAVDLFARAQRAGRARDDVAPNIMLVVFHSLGTAVAACAELRIDWRVYLTVLLHGLRAP